MKKGKTIETAQRALEILKELMHKELRVDDILDILAANTEYGIVYTKEAIYKYLNTFKIAGIKISKNKGIYSVSNSFFKFDLSDEDKYILNFLENHIYSTQQEIYKKEFNRIKNLIEKNNVEVFSNIVSLDCENIININKKYKLLSPIIKQLEKACYKRKKLIIEYRTEDGEIVKHNIVPNKIMFEKGFLVLYAYNQEYYEYYKYLIENILSVEILPQLGSSQFYIKNFVYRISGDLAKNYRLKKGEIVKEQGEDFIIISNNNNKSQKELLARLFKYGDMCKILYPNEIRDAVKNKIINTLALYKE